VALRECTTVCAAALSFCSCAYVLPGLYFHASLTGLGYEFALTDWTSVTCPTGEPLKQYCGTMSVYGVRVRMQTLRCDHTTTRRRRCMEAEYYFEGLSMPKIMSHNGLLISRTDVRRKKEEEVEAEMLRQEVNGSLHNASHGTHGTLARR